VRGIAFGLAGGGLVTLTMSLVYAQSREAFLSPVFQWSLVVVYIAAMTLPLLRRPQLERMAAIRTALVAYMLVSACYYMYTYALYEFFDPSLYELQSELMIENAQRYSTNTPGSAQQAPEQIYSPENLAYTPGGVAYSYALGILSGAAVAFLLGNLLGRSSPDPSHG